MVAELASVGVTVISMANTWPAFCTAPVPLVAAQPCARVLFTLAVAALVTVVLPGAAA
jgi:hypothetical protein